MQPLTKALIQVESVSFCHTAKTRKTHITIRYSIHLTSQQHFKQTFETKPKATELTFIMRFRNQKSMSYESKVHEL